MQVCLFRFAAQNMECDREQCAWWVDDGCAITKIALALDNIKGEKYDRMVAVKQNPLVQLNMDNTGVER